MSRHLLGHALWVVTAVVTSLALGGVEPPGQAQSLAGSAGPVPAPQPSSIERGFAHYNAGRWGDAITFFGMAVRVEPTNAIPYAYRGNCFLMVSNLDGAVSDLERAVRLDPRAAYAVLNLACAYRAKGEFEKSLRGFSNYLKMDPTNDFAYKSRASIHNVRGHFKEAIRDWNAGLRLRPKDPTALAMRGHAYFMTRQFASALSDFQQALLIDPGNESADNNLAWLRATCPSASFRSAPEAVAAATAACESSGWSNWTRLDTLAAALAEAGDFENAVLYERRALAKVGPTQRDLGRMNRRLRLYERHRPYHGGKD
jgi:tetratricopeptide (TPR) repeat protein